MNLDVPYWFRQRQAKAEELSRGCYKISGPNLPEGIISIRIGDELMWRGSLQSNSGEKDIATSGQYSTATEALAAAFELYRSHMIV